MKVLTQADIQRRLQFDYRIATSMQYELMKLTAHRTEKQAHQKQNPIMVEDQAHEAWFYSVEYSIPTLRGPGQVIKYTCVLIDLNKGGGYPFTMPEAGLLSQPAPWSPHFREGVFVCYSVPGALWSPDGSTLLGHLLIQIARLLNYDEPDFGPGYSGWNGEAAKHWREKMGCRPLTPDVKYPVLPRWLYSGLEVAGAASSTNSGATGIKILNQPSTPGIKILSGR